MVDLSGERPRVEARLSSEILNIARYIPDEKPPQKPTLRSREELEKEPPPSDDGRVFPADPLPLNLLNAANADIALKARKLVTPKGEFYDLDARQIGRAHV